MKHRHRDEVNSSRGQPGFVASTASRRPESIGSEFPCHGIGVGRVSGAVTSASRLLGGNHPRYGRPVIRGTGSVVAWCKWNRAAC